MDRIRISRPVGLAIIAATAGVLIWMLTMAFRSHFKGESYYQDAAKLQATEGVLVPNPNGGGAISTPIASDKAYQPERGSGP